MNIKNITKLIISVGICELAGVIGSIFTVPAISGWYRGLTKPQLAPPNWIFAPVWTILYLLMGVSLYLVWKNGFENKRVRFAMGVFAGQLMLNILWSYIFFGLNSPGAALIEIVMLWLMILACIFVFKKISKPAAWILVPYIVWVTFAMYLNFSIWILN